MTKLGNNKFVVGAMLCYFIVIIISGILIAISTAIEIHWTIALGFLAGWYFAFLIMPFSMDTRDKEDIRGKVKEYMRDR